MECVWKGLCIYIERQVEKWCTASKCSWQRIKKQWKYYFQSKVNDNATINACNDMNLTIREIYNKNNNIKYKYQQNYKKMVNIKSGHKNNL